MQNPQNFISKFYFSSLGHFGIILLSQVIAVNAFAWGAVGHKTTALIGEAYLTPQARAAVAELLDGQRLVDVVNWADTLRSQAEFSHTLPYHYQNMPELEGEVKRRDLYRQELSGLALPEGKTYSPGVVEAILTAEKNLANPSASREKKQMALKFLVHFIGDLHQPLHTGRAENRGGNMIALKWNGRDMNLHNLWDSGIIYDHMNSLGDSSEKDLSVVYGQWLFNRFAKSTIEKEGLDNVSSWYRESVSLQPVAYDEKYLSNPAEYGQKAQVTIDARIFLAGRRIGETLNKLMGQGNAAPQMAAPNVQLILLIQKMFGAIEQIVNLGQH